MQRLVQLVQWAGPETDAAAKAAAVAALCGLCRIEANLPALREPELGLGAACEAIVAELAAVQEIQQTSNERVYAKRAAEILQKLTVGDRALARVEMDQGSSS